MCRPAQYITGPLWLKDNVELRLEAGATIALSQNPADWPAGVPALINSQGAKNIAITGRGTIDGKAQYEYVAMRAAWTPRSARRSKSRARPESR